MARLFYYYFVKLQYTFSRGVGYEKIIISFFVASSVCNPAAK